MRGGRRNWRQALYSYALPGVSEQPLASHQLDTLGRISLLVASWSGIPFCRSRSTSRTGHRTHREPNRTAKSMRVQTKTITGFGAGSHVAKEQDKHTTRVFEPDCKAKARAKQTPFKFRTGPLQREYNSHLTYVGVWLGAVAQESVSNKRFRGSCERLRNDLWLDDHGVLVSKLATWMDFGERTVTVGLLNKRENKCRVGDKCTRQLALEYQ